jgi:CubicO group peptidase (beta-lactamase class C family)
MLQASARRLAPITLLGIVVAAPAAFAQSADALHSAARYAAEHAGDAVLIYHRDSLIFEEYQNGFDGRAPHPLASGTKAFTCVLAALAQGDGLLTIDEPVARTLPEFAADSELRRVTIRELLNLTSGLVPDPTGPGLTLASRPGQRFSYGGTSFALFGFVLSRKLYGEDLLAWLTRRIFTPLGITVGDWERNGSGQPGLASGAALTARAWGAYGLLLRDRGRWHGRQLVPSAGLEQCGRGSAANPSYGLGLWLNPPTPTRPPPAGVERAGPTDRVIDAPDLPHDLWLASGTGGQRLYILPSAGLVVVRFGHNTGPDYRDDVFLRTLLGRKGE